jgi:xylulose-5-phosphate/fructose-6-phosphate phosphoketolase
MLDQQLAQANPPPDPSLLPDSVLEYKVKLVIENTLSKDELNAIQMYRRAANYIAAGAYPIAKEQHASSCRD